MSMQDRMAASKERVLQLKAAATATPTKPSKPRIQVRMGGRVTIAMMRTALGLPTVGERLARWNEAKATDHLVGNRCPHCMGTGRYRFHTDAARNEKCYRCHGKGVLDTKDMAYLTRRLKGGEPLCWVTAATAA